jgi:hypothetical protein
MCACGSSGAASSGKRALGSWHPIVKTHRSSAASPSVYCAEHKVSHVCHWVDACLPACRDTEIGKKQAARAADEAQRLAAAVAIQACVRRFLAQKKASWRRRWPLQCHMCSRIKGLPPERTMC